jgi:hypothetical protein
MGLFKDLGFGTRNGVLVSANSSKFNGMSFAEVQTALTAQYGTRNIAADIDGMATIPYSAFTTTIDTSGIVDVFNDGSCVALYQFEGNTNDTSGAHNGVATNVNYSPGRFGTKSITAISDSSKVDLGVIQYNVAQSFSIWFNTPNNTCFMDNGRYGQSQYGQIWFQPNSLNFGVGGSSSTSVGNISWTPLYNQWNHVVFTVASNKVVTVYLNNNLVGSFTLSSWPTSTTYSTGLFTIDNTPNQVSQGSFDQIRRFNRVLTAAEVSHLYTETRKSSTILQATGQSDWYGYQVIANNLPATGNVYVNGSPQSNGTSVDSVYKKTIYGIQPAVGDGFGASVAIGASFILVGSYSNDDKGSNAGKVEMFDLSGNYIKTIYSNSPAVGDSFGASVAIGTNFFLVGSNFNDDKATDAGKVEMFDLSGNYIKTIYGNAPAASDNFGTSVAIGPNFFLVGSYRDDDKATDAGKVEMFDLTGKYTKTIYGNAPAASDGFGISVAIGASFFLVGSYLDDDKATDAGKVEMFDLSGNYTKTIYGNVPAAGDGFGASVAIGPNFFLVGSYLDDDKATDAGKVEIFDLNGNYIKTIYGNAPAAGDNFGSSIAAGTSFFLVGSYPNSDKGSNAGKVEMFGTVTTFPVQVINPTRELDISTNEILDTVQLNLWTGAVI